MHPERRRFLTTSAAAAAWMAGLAGSGAWLTGCTPGSEPKGSGARGAGLRLLVLGGTAFLGPAIVEAAKAKGWTITLFNRGRTNPHLFPELEKLRGDRDGDLEALEGRSWDAVVDTSGYFPRQVRDSASLLSGATERYVFVSSISVYADTSRPGIDETDPVGTLDDETIEEITGETYGPLKALCEQAAEASMPGRVMVVRPGLIVGPEDRSDRFTYWPVRVSRGGEVLAPGTPDDPVQLIDVRDLGSWIVACVERRVTGTFNATGPAEPLTMGGMLAACKAASGSDARFTWVSADFLESMSVAPWSDMPAWLPPTGETAGFARVDCSKAIAAGLVFRPILETAGDTLTWWREQPDSRTGKVRAGLAPEREREVLDAWHERSGAGSAVNES